MGGMTERGGKKTERDHSGLRRLNQAYPPTGKKKRILEHSALRGEVSTIFPPHKKKILGGSLGNLKIMRVKGGVVGGGKVPEDVLRGGGVGTRNLPEGKR